MTNTKKGCDPYMVITDKEAGQYYTAACRTAVHAYKTMLDLGVCREQARAVLPQASYTEFIETGSLWAYINMIKERTAPGAQQEIKEYALEIKEHLKKLFPVTFACI